MTSSASTQLGILFQEKTYFKAQPIYAAPTAVDSMCFAHSSFALLRCSYQAGTIVHCPYGIAG